MSDLIQTEYPILADENHIAAQEYNVYDLFNDGIAAPAAFIIAPDGKVTWQYIGKDINDSPAGEMILEQIPVP